jgi:hypothetical protein
MNAPDVTKQVYRPLGPYLTWRVRFLALMMVGLTACGEGGSGSGTPPPPPPAPDFSLSVSPTSQSVNAGSSASVSLSATALNGFASQISIQVTGAPAGVSVSPPSITLAPGTPQQVTFKAAANAANASAMLTFTGTAASLTHTTGLGLTVNALSTVPPVRTRYVRTDATTEYFEWVNQHWILYHTATSRYFVTDPSSNQIIVIDGPTHTEIGTIGVPGAFGIDQTPDQTTLYVGTQIGDVYAVDPVAMTVIKRYIASGIGPYGYRASSALVLSDGRLALIGLYNSVDGTGNFAVWNPVDNSITIYGAYGEAGSPSPCNGFQNLGGFALTADRTKILVGDIDGGGLCVADPSTGTGNAISTGFSLNILTTPDGKYIILPSPLPTPQASVTVYDAQTLATVTQFNVLGDTSSGSGFFVSADSTTLYTPADSIIYAYSLATQQLVGWVPNIFVQNTSGGFAVGPAFNPYLLATDGTGLFAGPMEEGVGFVDLSVLQTGPVGTQFTSGYLNPVTGPASGGTATQWSDESPVGMLKGINFGSNPATSISATSGSFNLTSISATSPPGTAGPADVYAFTTDGGMQLLPEGFSYGPTILEVTPNMATAEGGGTGYIYGYGFGPTDSNAIPSDLNVTVGGVAAQISAFLPNAYGIDYPPFQLEGIAYTIPPGVTGSTVNVALSTGSGSATATAALTYLPSLQQFPLTASTLAQGIYDPYTDLYYFTDTAQIQVFSRTQGKWLSPISIPAPSGTTQRLWGIALSPDGSKMAVSDASAGAIYLLDPATPSSVKTFMVGSKSPFTVNPCGLAISDAGSVYYMVFVIGQGGGADQFFKLNTNTGTITNYGINGPGSGQNDVYLRNAISSDNSRVFYNEDGYVFSIDSGTDIISPSLDGFTCCYGNYELSLSSNQTQFTATFYIYDSNLNGESYYALNDREILNIAYVYGGKLSPDGRLLFQPSTNGVDVFDGALGNLRNRISLPVALSPNYDALVDDGADNILLAITGTGSGIAIVDLTSVSEPPPLQYAARVAFRSPRLELTHNRWRGDSRGGEHPGQPATQRRMIPHVTRTVLPHSK